MSVRKAIHDILAEDGSVSGQVSDRIYLNFAPSGTAAPYIVFTYEGTDDSFTKSGPSDLDVFFVTINCYDENAENAETLSRYVRTALDNYKGTINGVGVSGCKYMDEDPDHDIDLNPYHEINFQIRIIN